MERPLFATAQKITAVRRTPAYTAAKAKYNALSKKYTEFSKAADLPEQRERLRIAKVTNHYTGIERESRIPEEFKSHFFIDIPPKGNPIKLSKIYGELQKSEVGKHANEHIINNQVSVDITYATEGIKGKFGQLRGNRIEIYAANTRSRRVTAETIIHEATHHELNLPKPTQWEEAYCIAQERKHIKSVLTVADLRDIIKTAKELYPELTWR